MRNTARSMLSALLVLVMLAGLMPVQGLDGQETQSFAVEVSVFGANAFLLPKQSVSVRQGLAESYGYEPDASAQDSVTALDALVAAHIAMFGEEDFTPDSAQKFLTVEAGSIKKLFGVETQNCGFAVNGQQPHGEDYTEGSPGYPGYYNGYTVAQAVLEENDRVEFMLYQDELGMDYYAWFENAQGKADELIEAQTTEIAGAQIALVEQSAFSDIEGVLSGENGEVTLTFDTPGRYVLSAYMPDEDIADDEIPVIAPWCEVTVNPGNSSITVPEGAQLFVGQKSKNYMPFTEVQSVGASGGTYWFSLNNGTYTYRVSMDGGVTYAGKFQKTSADYALTVTQDMLSGDPKATDHDLSQNGGYNVADIYLNANAQGSLQLDVKGTYRLFPMRSWQAVDTVVNNYFVEPDFHYSVIDFEGNASDVVTVSPEGLLTAQKEGTAVVLVTYYALRYKDAAGGELLGALWPENTGVLVVTVGGERASFKTGMTAHAGVNAEKDKLSGDALDAEHDVVYFTGEQGAYTFTCPDEQTVFSVARPVLQQGVLSYAGFEPAEKEQGVWSVPLSEGRNIVKAEKDGSVQYQVITAKKVSITVNGGQKAEPGSEVTVTFDTVYHPALKLAGIYNMSAAIQYTLPDGETVQGAKNQYKFASNAAAQTLTVTIPEDFKGDSFTLKQGGVYVSGFGDPYGSHRGVTPETGKDPNFTAAMRTALLALLPDVTIPVQQPASGGGQTPQTVRVWVSVYGDDAHGEGTVHTYKNTKDELALWLSETQVQVPAGGTAADAVEAALKGAGIDFENPSGGYITSVKGLSEQQNGPYSGWLYLLNGQYPAQGIDSQSVKDGDRIVLHYTDDYRQEQTSSVAPPEQGGGQVTPPVQTPTFSDVAADRWSFEDVEQAAKLGLMQGVSEGVFAPEQTLDRAMAVTVLYRLAGSPAVQDSGMLFSDVPQGAYYYDALCWAVQNGVAQGTGEGFEPSRAVTREELCTLIARTAQVLGLKNPGETQQPGFADETQISDFALDAVRWAAGQGIVLGEDGRFNPQGTATREQAAAMVVRFAGLAQAQ